MKKNDKVYIADHQSLVGATILNRLKKEGFTNVITKSAKELDLRRQSEVEFFFKKQRPGYVILSTAREGGIQANISYPAKLIYENLVIQNNVIHAAYLYGVKKLLFFGSACSYPRDCPQPMKEEYLFSGYLEPTSESYAVSKMAGIKMCQSYKKQYGINFISIIPATIYGLGDNFEPETSHVVPSLIERFHAAKINNKTEVVIWGTGKPRREFIYADDMIDACMFLMANYNESEVINVGCGRDISIKELVDLIKAVTGFRGKVVFDSSRPDGVAQKLLDNTKMTKLGWRAKTDLEKGIRRTYEWYKAL